MQLKSLVIGIGTLALIGCSAARADKPAKGAKAPEELSVEECAKRFEAKQAVPVDANGERTREKHGVVPGAILLSSASQFDAAKELPADKSTQLVFYCGNTMCTASDSAAERAMQAGYQNVKVMRAGIQGWTKAGKKTAKPAKKKG